MLHRTELAKTPLPLFTRPLFQGKLHPHHIGLRRISHFSPEPLFVQDQQEPYTPPSSPPKELPTTSESYTIRDNPPSPTSVADSQLVGPIDWDMIDQEARAHTPMIDEDFDQWFTTTDEDTIMNSVDEWLEEYNSSHDSDTEALFAYLQTLDRADMN